MRSQVQVVTGILAAAGGLVLGPLASLTCSQQSLEMRQQLNPDTLGCTAGACHYL